MTMGDPHDDLIVISSFSTPSEAAVARGVLAHKGIDSHIDGDVLAAGVNFGTSICGVRLLVRLQDRQDAIRILASNGEEDGSCASNFNDEATDTLGGDFREDPPELRRAFRAALVGMILFPPLLNLYSIYLLIRYRRQFSRPCWRIRVAIVVNVIVLFAVITLWILAPVD